MPVILREQDEAAWLNPRLSADEAQALLVPLPAELLMAYEVSPKVNSPAYNTPDVLTRLLGVPVDVAPDWLARLLSGGIGVVLARTYRGTPTNFMGFRADQRSLADLGVTVLL
jgi:SOS response associated peptidase (SRAP)